MPDLMDLLNTKAPEFNFFRAVALAEEYFEKKYNDPSPVNSGRLRLYSNPGLSFPPSDIAAFENRKETASFILSFCGLTGTDSPLPNYFSDYIARYPDDSGALSDFLAIFNRRIYALFYLAFRKYRTGSIITNAHIAELISRLAGRLTTGKKEHRLPPAAGILSTRRRSANGLEALVSGLLGGIPVTVKQWTGKYLPLPNPARLGKDCRLGRTAAAGTHIFDIAGKFRIIMGPANRTLFESLTESSANISIIREIVSDYTREPLDFDMEIIPEPSHLDSVVLGESIAALGRNAALGTTEKNTNASVIIEGRVK